MWKAAVLLKQLGEFDQAAQYFAQLIPEKSEEDDDFGGGSWGCGGGAALEQRRETRQHLQQPEAVQHGGGVGAVRLRVPRRHHCAAHRRMGAGGPSAANKKA